MIRELKKLMGSAPPDISISDCLKENVLPNKQRIQWEGDKKGHRKKEDNIYSSIKCEDCDAVMTPCQYFNHLRNEMCPLKF